MPFGRHTGGVQGRRIVLDGVSDPAGEGEIWGVELFAKNCSCPILMIHQGAAPISDFTCYEITFDLLIITGVIVMYIRFAYFAV